MNSTYKSRAGAMLVGAAAPIAMLGFTLTASANDDMSYSDDPYQHSALMDHTREFSTHMMGSKEVPPVDEGVTGDTKVSMNDDGGNMYFVLNVQNGHQVTMSHLHCAPEGANGPIVVTLFHNEDGVDINGQLASGDISDGDIASTGAKCADTIGHPIHNVQELADAIKNGQIYVNVHTEAHPAGAARGQLMDTGYTNNQGNNYNNTDDCNTNTHYNNDDHAHQYGNHESDNRDYNHDNYVRHDDSYNKSYNAYNNDNRDDHSWYDGKDGKDGSDGKDGHDGYSNYNNDNRDDVKDRDQEHHDYSDNDEHHEYSNNDEHQNYDGDRHDDDSKRNDDHRDGWSDGNANNFNLRADSHASVNGILNASAHASLGY
jgi:hypothetical protein